ncbi:MULTISPECIES: YfiR family protein [Flammeovirga]|uniref:YfiR family protein n=1 Tax=Flammeovirga agarivorans TaxID=2726742 RepID=A0A7X8SQ32_9BACT|nr:MULTISPECIES: YfiR family protein [Flammeovirga]NLR94255.1 YfiR family protein [Flammeovirga agarivorans]
MNSQKQNISPLIKAIIIGCCLFFLNPIKSNAQFDEYERKAAMINTFAKFVNWPSQAFKENNKLVLGILGDDPFGEVIDNMFRNRYVNGRAWEIRRGQSIKDLKGSHIVFMTQGYSNDEVKSLLGEIYEKNNSFVLTIGDNIPNFCKNGGIINLTPNGLYTLNIVSANKAQLTIDVKLLNLASDIIPYDPD